MMGDPILIPLDSRKGVTGYALLSPGDSHLAERAWHRDSKGYVRHIRREDGAAASYYMHRLVLGLEKGDSRQADHINGDRLDNRRSNLRIVTAAQNRQNTVRSDGRSKFRGVDWMVSKGKWRAAARLGGKYYHLGLFESENDAGTAASLWRAEHMPFTNEGR